MKIFGRKEIQDHVGTMSQLCGLKRVILAEGVGKGVEAIEVRTGGGLDFTVLVDRGLDISRASYQGHSLVWLSAAGEVHPAYYDDRGLGWLRTFPGGLVTTCGLTQMGMMCVDDGKELGLHGRFSCTPASRVALKEEWVGNQYQMTISGEVREAVLFGENILLKREISCVYGVPELTIKDTVINEGFRTTPHMILYHCNFGFPLLSADTVLVSSSQEITPRDEEAKKGMEDACRFNEPLSNYKEKVYFHRLTGDRKGNTTVSLINPKLENGLMASVSFNLRELPYFTQWKNMGKGEYVCGLEPGNALVTGRVNERKAGRLVMLRPGENKHYTLKITISPNTI